MSLAEAPLLLGKFGPVKEQGHATQCLGKVDEKEYWKIPPPLFICLTAFPVEKLD